MLVSYKKIFEKMYELALSTGSKLHIHLKPHWSGMYERPESMIKNNQWTLNVGGAATNTGVHFSDFGITFAVRFNGTPFTFDLPWGSFLVDVSGEICEAFGVDVVSTYTDMIVFESPEDSEVLPLQAVFVKVTYKPGETNIHEQIPCLLPRTTDLEDLALFGGEHGYLKNFIKPVSVPTPTAEPPKVKRPTLTVVK